MERCVHKHIFNYITSHKLLSPLQSGFVRGDSTINQLLSLYHTFCEAVDSGKEVVLYFSTSVRRLTEFGTEDSFLNSKVLV